MGSLAGLGTSGSPGTVVEQITMRSRWSLVTWENVGWHSARWIRLAKPVLFQLSYVPVICQLLADDLLFVKAGGV